MDRMEKGLDHCQSRNRHCLASSRFSPVLAFSIAFQKTRQASKNRGSSICYPKNERRERRLGRSKNSRRALEAGFRGFRTIGLSLSFRHIFPSDQVRKLWATFIRKHREIIAATDFFTVPTITFRVLYCFYNRAWTPQDPSFQCHRKSNQFLDSAATKGSIPRSVSVSICAVGSRFIIQQRCNRSCTMGVVQISI